MGGKKERRKQIKRGRVSKLQNNDLRLFRFVVSHFVTINKLPYFDIYGTATNWSRKLSYNLRWYGKSPLYSWMVLVGSNWPVVSTSVCCRASRLDSTGWSFLLQNTSQLDVQDNFEKRRGDYLAVVPKSLLLQRAWRQSWA